MRAPFSRLFVAFPIAAILVFSLAGIASANVVSKTINTTLGECTKNANGDPVLVSDGVSPCGAAVYGTDGFTGHITFADGEGPINIIDFICEKSPTTSGIFMSVLGHYTLALSDTGGALIGSPWSYDITAATECDGITTHQASYPVSLTVPTTGSDYTVAYSLLLDSFDFTGDNSILNRVEEEGANQANSASVAPPQGTPPVPEAPLTVLLLGSGVLTAVWYVSRKLRQSVSLTAA